MSKMARVDLKKREEIALSKRERTKLHLMQSAMECFAEKGIASVTTDDICKAAKTSRGTFYNYFNDIDDVIIAVLKEVQLTIEGQVSVKSENVALGPERLAIALRELFDIAEEDPVYGKLFLYAIESNHAEKFENVFKNRLFEDIHAGQVTGEFTLTNDVVAADILRGTVYFGIRSILRGEISANSTPEYLDSIFRALGMSLNDAVRVSRYSFMLEPECQDKSNDW